MKEKYVIQKYSPIWSPEKKTRLLVYQGKALNVPTVP